MKNWLLKTFFAKELIQAFEEAKKQGSMDAFSKAHQDILETMADDLDKKAEELAKVKINDLYSIVDMKRVITLNKSQGIMFIGGERAEEGRLANLHAEAEFFLQSDLWTLIYESAKELAHKSMFVSGETLADLQKGRAMLYTLQSQKNVIELLKNYQPKPIAQKNKI